MIKIPSSNSPKASRAVVENPNDYVDASYLVFIIKKFRFHEHTGPKWFKGERNNEEPKVRLAPWHLGPALRR